jgi:hypothetical protein
MSKVKSVRLCRGWDFVLELGPLKCWYPTWDEAKLWPSFDEEIVRATLTVDAPRKARRAKR